ncbi:MAG: hypothetical protein ACJAQT_004045 [Akkermansiaceae bacterium]|jgi:hypothetical protein
MSLLHEQPFFAEGTLHFREFTYGLPFEASLTEAKNEPAIRSFSEEWRR